MSYDASAMDSDGEPSGIIASIIAVDPPANNRRQRSRLVRIGSTNDSANSITGDKLHNASTTSCSGEETFLETATNVAGVPSLLQPHVHTTPERVGGSTRGFASHASQNQQPQSPRRQPSHRMTDGGAIPNGGSSLRGQHTHAVVMIDPVDAKGDARGGAAGPKRSTGRDAAGTNRTRVSRSVSVPFASSLGSRPGSPLQPPSNRGSVFSNFRGTITGASNASGGRERSSDPVRSGPASPNTAASTALLFPTTTWIRTALGMDGKPRASGGGARDAASPRETAGGGAGPVTQQSPASPAAAATPAATNAAPPAAATKDSAMRLHEQRVQAALRSQEEMRDFGVTLRRLEEEGAQVLREQRKRRQERQARLRGSVDGGRPRRRGHGGRDRATPSTGAGEAQRRTSGGSASSHGADDDDSDDFSDSTDDDEDGVGRGGEGGGVGDAGDLAGTLGGARGGGGARQTSKAAVEVHGAAKMSRVALLKLRDRTAREWVVLQRRRLEQHRGGPAGLQRHMQASQVRLQATRTGAAAPERSRTQDDALALTATLSEDTTERLVLPPLHESGPSLHPVAGSSMAISWGEQQAVSAAPTADDHVSDAGTNHGGEEEQEEQEGMESLSGMQAPPQMLIGADEAARLLSATADMARTPLSPHQETACTSPVAAAAPSHTSGAGTGEGVSSMAVGASLDHEDAASSAQSTSLQITGNDGAALAGTGAPTSNALACTSADLGATMVSPMGEDERLRRELQRLLFQANECTLYGLDQCLNSRARTKLVVATTASSAAQRHRSPAEAKEAARSSVRRARAAAGSTSRNATPSGGSPDTPSHALAASRAAASTSTLPSTPQRLYTGSVLGSGVRRTSLPRPLHRQLALNFPSPAVSVGRASGSIGLGGETLKGPASHSQLVEAARVSHISTATAAGGAGCEERAATLTPTTATGPLFPPLGRTSERLQPSFAVASPAPTTPVASSSAAAAGKRGAASPPPVRQPVAGREKTQPAHRRFAAASSRRTHQRAPLPVERGVGEHAAALLRHEILLTRRCEMEAERGNAREIDRACETLEQLFPLRRQLLDQDMQRRSAAVKGRTTTTTKDATGAATAASAGTPPPSPQAKGDGHTISLTSSPSPSPSSSAAAAAGAKDTAVDRSYHPQSVLQRHRQLLYDEAVRLQLTSRAAARDAYLDVLTQLAQRHVSSISWPVVERMLTEARAQLRQEVDTAKRDDGNGGNSNNSDDSDDLHSVSAERATAVSAAAPPRDKIQHLITTHLGVLELSQWPVQEVLQHLAALYRVPLHLLHEGIAEKQRRFAHSYNYEERFRAVDRSIGAAGRGGAAADCVLRLTLHRCRRPPLAPSRESAMASAAPLAEHGTGTAGGAAAAAADALAGGSIDPQSEPLFYIRLRVGQEAVSSSAVPLSSVAAGGSAAAASARFAGDTLSHTTSSSTSSSSSTTKVLSFMGQTLTLYLPTTGPAAAARKRRSTAAAYGTRLHTHLTADGLTTAAADAGDKSGASTAVVELMQSGVSAPLARGTVDLDALGLHSYSEGGRLSAQSVQIPLRRKGYRTAELKATVEVTS